MIREPAVIIVAMAAKTIDKFGALHIIVGDWNVEDSNIEFCMEQEDITAEEAAWLVCFSGLDEDQRLSALALSDGYWSLNDPAPSIIRGETSDIPPDLLAKMKAAAAN